MLCSFDEIKHLSVIGPRAGRDFIRERERLVASPFASCRARGASLADSASNTAQITHIVPRPPIVEYEKLCPRCNSYTRY